MHINIACYSQDIVNISEKGINIEENSKEFIINNDICSFISSNNIEIIKVNLVKIEENNPENICELEILNLDLSLCAFP